MLDPPWIVMVIFVWLPDRPAGQSRRKSPAGCVDSISFVVHCKVLVGSEGGDVLDEMKCVLDGGESKEKEGKGAE
jgi:hypothetical protein